MKCLVLAAGYATRLYPLTENFPKPLLNVGEKTILDWLLDDIHASCPAEEYIVISNHKYAHCFEEWAKGKSIPVSVLDDGTDSNETRLGAVRDIQFAIEEKKLDDDLLVIAGDNVLDFSLGAFIAYARGKDTSCIMRYFEPNTERLKKCGVVLRTKTTASSVWRKSLPSRNRTGAVRRFTITGGRMCTLLRRESRKAAARMRREAL